MPKIIHITIYNMQDVNSKERRPRESIAQWKQRLKWLNRNGTYATIEPAIVRADSSSISQDRRVLGRKPNDYGVSSNASIQRQYIENPSIAQKVINGITDALHITRPPTFTDGYGVERNAEVPLSESAQGQELKRIGKTAMTGLGIVTIPTIIGSLVKAPLATAAMLGAGTAADKGTKAVLNTVNKNLQNVKLSPEQINTAGFLASLPAMGAANKWGHAVTRRGLETIMHTSGSPNPAPEVQRYWKQLSPGDKAKTLNYIITGRFTPGSNTLGRYEGKPIYYTGFSGTSQTITPKPGMDAVRTYLYGEPLADLTEIKNSNYGPHENYILRNYPRKNIKVYEGSSPRGIFEETSVIKASSEPASTIIESAKNDIPIKGNTGQYYNYDAAGHLRQNGIVNGDLYTREQDIWKFNPNDYVKRWLKDKELNTLDGKPLNPNKGTGWIKKLPLRWGLHVVDHYGTPFIVRTPWARTIERNSIINDNVPFNTAMKDLQAEASQYINVPDKLPTTLFNELKSFGENAPTAEDLLFWKKIKDSAHIEEGSDLDIDL